MSNRQQSQKDRTGWLAAGGGLALVLCCAGPALIAGGILTTIGQVASNGLVIALGMVVIVGALVFALTRHSRRCPPDEDCLPAAARSTAKRTRR